MRALRRLQTVAIGVILLVAAFVVTGCGGDGASPTAEQVQAVAYDFLGYRNATLVGVSDSKVGRLAAGRDVAGVVLAPEMRGSEAATIEALQLRERANTAGGISYTGYQTTVTVGDIATDDGRAIATVNEVTSLLLPPGSGVTSTDFVTTWTLTFDGDGDWMLVSVDYPSGGMAPMNSAESG